jgi:hypothetical protein
MTEAEWLACDDLQQLIKARRHAGYDRKLRLFACACVRNVNDRLPDGAWLTAVEIAERFADAPGCRADLDDMYHTATRAWGEANQEWSAIISTGMSVLSPEAGHAALLASAHSCKVGLPKGTISRKVAMAAVRQRNLILFRCVFGNPFRPVTFAPEWRTDTAVALAAQMYEAPDFSALPILADALQDAGCDNEDVLSHCRGGGPHGRGCWVVDLVLGKE